MLAPAARSAACRYFLTGRTSTARKKMNCRAGAGCARGPSTHTLSSPPGEEEASVASSSLASSGAWAAGCRGEVVSLKEWQGWGTSSPVPAMVTKVVDDLMALERETDAEMTFGGIGGKLQGSFKVQEDKKHREVYQALDDSELKLQFFAARQIACRLLGSRGYLCQKDFLRQNNTGKLLWQVFGIQSASLCLFGILEHEEIMWDAFKRAGKDFVWLLYPNKSKTTMSVPDILLQSPMEYPKDQLYQENDKKTLNFVLIDGTWSNASAMYKRLKEHAKLLWGEDDLPCITLSSLGVSVMHKLRPQPAWDRTCTAAAAIGLLSELNIHPELSSCGLDKQAEALDTALDVLLDALTKRRLRLGRSITRKERNNLH